MTDAKKGATLNPNDSGRGFWDHLAFTRIVHFRRDFSNMGQYLRKNLFEAFDLSMKKLLAQGYQILTIGKEGLLPKVLDRQRAGAP